MPRAPRGPVCLASGPLEVCFEWAGDRFGHRVSLASAGLWRSVEGTGPNDDPRWPESAALVEVTRLGGGPAEALMAVGQAGRTHFSAAIAPDPEVPDAIRFDVAARIQEPPRWLGATYASDGLDGPPDVIRVGPADAVGGPLPRTVRWCYRVSARGIEPLSGTRLAPPGET